MKSCSVLAPQYLISRIWLALLCLIFLSSPCWAAKAPKAVSTDKLAFRSNLFQVASELVEKAAISSLDNEHRQALRQLEQQFPNRLEVLLSRESGVPIDAVGPGIPLPAAATQRANDIARLDSAIGDLIDANPQLFGVRHSDLVLNPQASQRYDNKWAIVYKIAYKGVLLEGSQYNFNIADGYITGFGGFRVANHLRQNLSVRPTVGLAEAEEIVRKYVSFQPGKDEVHSQSDLVVSAVRNPDYVSGRSPVGTGIEYRLLWKIKFSRAGENRLWTVWVDAHSGEILRFEDEDIQWASAFVKGGVYPKANDGDCAFGGCEMTDFPMPFADVYRGTGSAAVCSGSGIYNFTSATSSQLRNDGITGGNFIRLHAADNFTGCATTVSAACSATPNEPSDLQGTINFGTKDNPTDTDCAFPTGHTQGSTAAGRTSFYWANRVKETCRYYQPANTSCSAGGTLTDLYVNMNDVCNAFRCGNALVMFTSGGGCRNTGENPTILIHEIGHFIDANDGSGSNKPIEAYADIVGFLMTQESCNGRGFLETGNCDGYGDACLDCAGIRDVDWRNHQNNVPHTASNFVQSACTGGTYFGPCGGEDHCESLIASESVWDAAQYDIPSRYGLSQETSFALVNRLFWQSGPTMDPNMYTCASFVTDGCSTGSLYKRMLFFDDPDGDISNGTPHMVGIYNAFDRHGLACATPAAQDSASGCTVPGTITDLTAQSNVGSVTLTWTAASNATHYRIMKNDAGCGMTFNITNTVTSASACSGGTCTYTDTDLFNCVNYFYKVQPYNTNGSCEGAVSNCISGAAGNVGVPGNVTTTTPSANTIRVSWSSVPGASSYKVYRAAKAACSETPFFSYLGSTAGTTYDDSGVSGGFPYSYAVRAVSGSCESALSSCSSTVATGSCLDQPTFCDPNNPGQAHLCPFVENTGTDTPFLRVRWLDGASSNCASSNIQYNIYRSTSPSFTKDGTTRVATGLPASTRSWEDKYATCGQASYYTVRAEDSVGTGGSGPNGGIEETNNYEFQQTPYVENILYSDNFESTAIPTNWTITGSASLGDWVIGNPNQASASGLVGQPEDDFTFTSGTEALYTGVNAGGQTCCDDVDSGDTIASSTSNINASGTDPVYVSYWRWFHTTGGAEDYFRSYYSSNGGTGYTQMESISARSVPYKYYVQDISSVNNATMRFRFAANDSNPQNHVESVVDDLKVFQRSCVVACTYPQVPTNLAATANGNNRIDLSWTAVTADSYRVYRSTTSGGPYTQIASGVGVNSYSDTSASGGVTYYYVVTAFNNPKCESDYSGQASASTTGPCIDPPSFAALTSATPSYVSTCTVNLSWSAGSAVCSGPLYYNIYRSTNSSFDPAPSDRIVSGVTGASYTDTVGMSSGTTYYYVVRAVDSSNGVEETNTTRRNATPRGAYTSTTLYSNNFDSCTGYCDWTHGTFGGGGVNDSWLGVQACTANSSPNIFRFGSTTNCTADYQKNSDSWAVPDGATGIFVPAGSQNTRLNFYHRWNFESGVDGAYLYISTNGTNFTYIPSSAILSGSYNGTVDGLSAYTGTQNTFVNTVVDLDLACDQISGNTGGCTGKTIYVLFNGYAPNDNTVDDGWFLDDVVITAEQPGTCTSTTAVRPIPASMQASKLVADGSSIRVTWNGTSCPDSNYNIIYGSGNQVSSYTVGGQQCSIGTSGPYDWSAPSVASGEFVWWIVVGEDGASTESSWGKDSDGNERHPSASGVCGNSAKSTATCP